MWDAIEELEPTVEVDAYQGNLLLVFLEDADPESDPAGDSLHFVLEKKFARAPGGRDLRFAFAYRTLHAAHLERFRVRELPASVFVREGIEIDRSTSEDDVLEMAREIIKRYS